MIDPNPPNEDKYSLRGPGRPTPTDDKYKMWVIRFLHDDNVEATYELRQKEMAKHYEYIGVSQADIRNALVPEDEKIKPLIGAGDNRLPRMLSELGKLKLVERTDWILKYGKQPHTYYTLTEDGEKMWDEVQKVKERKISELLYSFKSQDGMIRRYGGKRLVEKFSLEKA